MYQKQPDIYPRAVKGWFAAWRWTFVWLTQLFFYGLPWIQWGGRQAVLFDLEAQRFYILGLVLYPQDLIFLAALLVLSALALFFFTAVAGRGRVRTASMRAMTLFKCSWATAVVWRGG
jgi:polyferredoxin